MPPSKVIQLVTGGARMLLASAHDGKGLRGGGSLCTPPGPCSETWQPVNSSTNSDICPALTLCQAPSMHFTRTNSSDPHINPHKAGVMVTV